MVQAKSGLLLDPYFSGSQMGWALKNWPQLRDAGDRLAVGTIESYLVYRLTGGVHVTDATNASRTLLMAIDGAHGWRSEEHTSELQSLMRISYAGFRLKKTKSPPLRPALSEL